MRPLHRVAGLKCRNGRPAIFKEHGPCLGRADIQFGILFRILPFRQTGDTSSQVELTLLHNLLYTGVVYIGGAVDLLTFQGFVRNVFFRNFHDRENFTALTID